MAASPSEHDVFQAISDPTRRRLLIMLADKEMPVAAIVESFPISRTAVNKHLHVLCDAGLLSRRRIGRETRYRLQPEPLLEVRDWLAYFDQYWDDRLAALKKWVEADDD